MRVNKAFSTFVVLLALVVLVSAGKKGGSGGNRCNIKTVIDPSNCVLEADYIVVGAGGGGAPLLRKLSDDYDYSVLGFEAGTYREDDPNVRSPFGSQAVSVTGTATYGFQMKTAQDTGTGKVFDISIGRLLGGSTSHNGMMYVRGSPQLFNQWQSLVGPTWSSAEINAAYNRIENYTNENSPVNPNRGSGGLLDVRRPANGPSSGAGSIATKIAEWTAQASGIPVTPDYNDPATPVGPFVRYDLFQTPATTRESSSSAFLPSSVLNPDGTGVGNRKLRIFWQSSVTRVLIEYGKAVGVEVLINGVTHRAYAKKEVILAASIFSTQILQNSGVGNGTALHQHGIQVKVNNPNVGRHLQNHKSLASLTWTFNPNDGPIGLVSDPAGLYGGGAVLPSWNAQGPIPASELSKPRKYQILWLPNTANTFRAYIMQLMPESEGSTLIQSKDPLQVPLHQENMFQNPNDLDDFANFIYYGLQNTLTPVMQADDPSVTMELTFPNVDAVKAHILAACGTAYHYSSTNRMAYSAATGVVDAQGRVFGVQRLRVADSSILPTAVDGNTGAPAVMVGFRIAEFIIASR
jgi:choline dehydrogenase